MKIRYYWVDIVKILACFFVIINHTLGYVFNFSGINHNTVFFYSILFSICKIGVPLFIMATGYLLLQDTMNNSYKKNLWRVFRVIVPLLGISLLLYIKNVGFSNFSIFEFIIDFFANPAMIYLWYIYMLVGLYLTIPFLIKMIKNFNYKDYLYFIIFFMLIPSLLIFVNNVLDFNFSNYFTIALFPIFIAFLLAGLYISKISLSKKNLYISIGIFTVCFMIFFLYMYLNYCKYGEVDRSLDSYNILLVNMSLSFFYIIRYFFETKKMSKIIKKIIREISLVTFGIYLLHYLITYRIYNLGIMQSVFEANYILGYGIMVITIFMLSGIVIFVCRKIPILKKFL